MLFPLTSGRLASPLHLRFSPFPPPICTSALKLCAKTSTHPHKHAYTQEQAHNRHTCFSEQNTRSVATLWQDQYLWTGEVTPKNHQFPTFGQRSPGRSYSFTQMCDSSGWQRGGVHEPEDRGPHNLLSQMGQLPGGRLQNFAQLAGNLKAI
ncbi:unnamed protein product [Protopolystoma xenopodis]|uniref:Uncharacterized protein n=1 Tax=Protopolystoma xenopodis TaxID=117903 RepID=A0A3S5CQ05_9PLAT|nr:unnamed protein product [Protopolystoma xenopodis]